MHHVLAPALFQTSLEPTYRLTKQHFEIPGGRLLGFAKLVIDRLELRVVLAHLHVLELHCNRDNIKQELFYKT